MVATTLQSDLFAAQRGQQAARQVLAREVGEHPVFDVWRQRVGPLSDSLVMDAELPGRLRDASTADGLEHVCLEHSALNHDSSTESSVSISVHVGSRTVPEMETFSERLAHAMQLAGVDKAELADRLDVSFQAISQVLRGKAKSMSAENTAEAAVALGVDWYWLATGKGTPRLATTVTANEKEAQEWRETARWAADQAGSARITPTQFLRVVDFLALNRQPAQPKERSEYVQKLLDLIGAA